MGDFKHFNVSKNRFTLLKHSFVSLFAIVIIFNFFRFHRENNVAPDLLLYYKLLQHVAEDKNKGFYGLGQSASHALRPFVKQCAHGSSLWNTHEVPGGKHHRL